MTSSEISGGSPAARLPAADEAPLAALARPRIITYDVEIALAVEEHPDRWKGAMRGECGISSIALYDTHTQRYHVYGPSVALVNGRFEVAGFGTLLDAVDHLNGADILLGWNNLGFDRHVIEGFTGMRLTPLQYDLLDIARGKNRFEKGWKLGMTAERNLGLKKTENGIHAPFLFQEGRIAELYDYNINDVHLTRLLANLAREQGYLIGPTGSSRPVTPLEYAA